MLSQWCPQAVVSEHLFNLHRPGLLSPRLGVGGIYQRKTEKRGNSRMKQEGGFEAKYNHFENFVNENDNLKIV